MKVLQQESEADVAMSKFINVSKKWTGLLVAGLGLRLTAATVGKGGYHLLNPTPQEAMRDFATDRPDKTESPYTVDAGHFQIEMDLVTYERDHDRSGGNDVLSESWAIAPINFKVGLCQRVDLQVVVETYNWVTSTDRLTGTRDRQSGYGDTTTRLKVNVWGNDGGTTALALMPYAKIPSNQDGLGNSAYEGGLIVPLSVDLGRGFGLGLMTQFDVLKNDANSDYHLEFVNSITLGHNIIGNLDGYIEFWSSASANSGQPWLGTMDLGFTYGVTENIQMDCGVNIGVTRSAPDIQPFVGLSIRY